MRVIFRLVLANILFINTIGAQQNIVPFLPHTSVDTQIEIVNKRVSTQYGKPFNPFDPVTYGKRVCFPNDTFLFATEFYHSHFKGEADFKTTTYLDIGNFGFAVFDSEVNFSKSNFEGIAYFKDVRFESAAFFDEAQFQHTAQFDFDTFCGPASFIGGKFNANTIDHLNLDTYDGTYFANCSFLKGVTFANSRFSNALYLQNSYANGLSLCSSEVLKVNFTHAVLDAFLDFGHTNAHDDIDFYRASLPPVLNFSSFRPDKEVDLTTIKATSPYHYINLYNADLSKIVIDYETFKLCFFDDVFTNQLEVSIDGHRKTNLLFTMDSLITDEKTYALCDTEKIIDALLNDFNFYHYTTLIFPAIEDNKNDAFFETLFSNILAYNAATSTKYHNLKMHSSFVRSFIKLCLHRHGFPKVLEQEIRTSIYEKELKNFKDLGLAGSYESLDIEYQNTIHNPNIIPHIWNCYGYHKEWVFWWIAICLFFYSAITTACFKFLNSHVYIINFPTSDNSSLPAYELYHSLFLKRMWYSYVYTIIIFFRLTLELEKFRFKLNLPTILGTAYVLFVYLSGIACMAYTAALILQK